MEMFYAPYNKSNKDPPLIKKKSEISKTQKKSLLKSPRIAVA